VSVEAFHARLIWPQTTAAVVSPVGTEGAVSSPPRVIAIAMFEYPEVDPPGLSARTR